MNSHAAGLTTREWRGQPDPAAITALAKYRFIAQVTHHGQPSRPFAVAGVSVEEVFGQPPDTDAAVNLPGPGRNVGDVAAHLETLDERIFKKLRALRKDPDRDTPPVRATDRSYAPVRASGDGRPR